MTKPIDKAAESFRQRIAVPADVVMSKFRGFIKTGELRERRRKLTGNRLPKGYLGIAARELTTEGIDLTEKNIEQWRELTKDEMTGFMGGEPLAVHSSNVAAAQYIAHNKWLIVEFKDAQFYRYKNVDKGEAASFLAAMSKGGWVWSELRRRGSKTAHRKPYDKFSGFITATRSTGSIGT